MELGADALLINTAIAGAKNPAAMARAMSLAGRLAYLAGRIPKLRQCQFTLKRHHYQLGIKVNGARGGSLSPHFTLTT